MPKTNRTGVTEICQNAFPYYNTLTLVVGQDGKCYLVAYKQHKIDNLDREQIRFDVTEARLLKLASELFEYFNRKQKFKDWSPSIGDWQTKMQETYQKGDALYMWFIDWVREVVTMKECREVEYKELIRIYEWMKGAEDWLYGRR
jgi:hypothetical protein